jgi:hypothetical protein
LPAPAQPPFYLLPFLLVSAATHALVILDFYTGPTPALHPP